MLWIEVELFSELVEGIDGDDLDLLLLILLVTVDCLRICLKYLVMHAYFVSAVSK